MKKLRKTFSFEGLFAGVDKERAAAQSLHACRSHHSGATRGVTTRHPRGECRSAATRPIWFHQFVPEKADEFREGAELPNLGVLLEPAREETHPAALWDCFAFGVLVSAE